METKFQKRHKCPDSFDLIGKSIPSDTARGGVAVYKKKNVDLEFQVFENISRDMVVFMINGTNLLFIAT